MVWLSTARYTKVVSTFVASYSIGGHMTSSHFIDDFTLIIFVIIVYLITL
jgi:hypothetical protein